MRRLAYFFWQYHFQCPILWAGARGRGRRDSDSEIIISRLDFSTPNSIRFLHYTQHNTISNEGAGPHIHSYSHRQSLKGLEQHVTRLSTTSALWIGNLPAAVTRVFFVPGQPNTSTREGAAQRLCTRALSSVVLCDENNRQPIHNASWAPRRLQQPGVPRRAYTHTHNPHPQLLSTLILEGKIQLATLLCAASILHASGLT